MEAVRSSVRPKHQVLVLKCFPKVPKNSSNDAKPNSSELSYLLYYASTRRSKLQKVGDFIEKRTASDVWKGHIGYVQVSLQILKALIEKCPRDLPLYAPNVLRILRSVLQSRDVTMVEESVPTFISYCTHQDPANLAADQANITQFEEIIKCYAGFAQQGKVGNPKVPTPWPVAIRFRKAGLEAIKSIASSDSMGSETGRQLAVIIPAILQNLYAEDGTYLQTLQSRDEIKEEQEKEIAIRRRQSISTVRTFETSEADPAAAAGTIEDADKLAEEEVGAMALQALRNVFLAASRVQLRLATKEVLKFVTNKVETSKDVKDIRSFASLSSPAWASTIFALICGWASVQDRYAILVTTVETLIRSPILEKELLKQTALVEVIRSLLSSNINFIGLSVIDVLVGFVQHILLLLQLGGDGTAVHPHHQQADVVESPTNSRAKLNPTPQIDGKTVIENITTASKERKELVALLQKCIGGLATHLYYTDQVSDMILTILTRLKPPPTSAAPTAAAAVENPNGAIAAVMGSANLKENEDTDPWFSFETASLVAIAAIRDILMIANSKKSDGTSTSVGRPKVDVSVWDGTEWLMRDPNAKVRRAYVDVIITWLSLETSKVDLRVNDQELTRKASKKEKTARDSSLVKRAVSNASHRERSPMRHKSTFLQLLHLAIYDNAHQHSECDAEFVLMHLMLTNLVRYLGVNSIRAGLPMIMRLQEDINDLRNPGHKVRIASLVYGYLWALTSYLSFETTEVGQEIHGEISRRAREGVWLKIMLVPPMSLSQIEMLAEESSQSFTPESLGPDPFRPFEKRGKLIDAISDGYGNSLFSPPSTPAMSPARSFSIPILAPGPMSREPLPMDAKEDLMSDWSKEACIANTNVTTSRTASVSGSRTGNTTTNSGLLGVNVPNWRLSNLSNIEIISLQGGGFGYAQGFPSPKHGSVSGSPLSSSSAKSAVRVEDLKKVLSGATKPPLSMVVNKTSAYNDDDTASESMVSADFSPSEISFVTAKDKELRSPDRPPTPKGLNIPIVVNEPQPEPEDPNGIPPVPLIPPSFRNSVSPSRSSSDRSVGMSSPYVDEQPSWGVHETIYEGDEEAEEYEPVRKSRSIRRDHSRHRSQGTELGTESFSDSRHSRPDFSILLDEIDVGDDSRDGSPQWRPPY